MKSKESLSKFQRTIIYNDAIKLEINNKKIDKTKNTFVN